MEPLRFPVEPKTPSSVSLGAMWRMWRMIRSSRLSGAGRRTCALPSRPRLARKQDAALLGSSASWSESFRVGEAEEKFQKAEYGEESVQLIEGSTCNNSGSIICEMRGSCRHSRPPSVQQQRSSPALASMVVYKKEQLPLVRAGAPILVATPGRLNDFLENEFPHVDYRLLKQHDPLWSAQRESQASMVACLHRQQQAHKDCELLSRMLEEVALVAHCSINFTMLNAVVDCSLDPHLTDWFVTAEMRSMRVLWEEPRKETAKFIDGGHLDGLAKGHCQLYPRLLRIAQEGDEDSVHLRRDYQEFAASGHVALICGGSLGRMP